MTKLRTATDWILSLESAHGDDMIERLLQADDLPAIAAATVDDAIKAVDQHGPPTLILIDGRMRSEASGRLIPPLRQFLGSSRIPIVLHSTGDDATVSDALTHGASVVLAGSLNEASLASWVRSIVTARRSAITEAVNPDIVIDAEGEGTVLLGAGEGAFSAASMVAALAHKIRTPLTGVTVGLELAAEQAERDSEVQEMVFIALDAAHRLQRTFLAILSYLDGITKTQPSAPCSTSILDPAQPAQDIDLPDDLDLTCRLTAPVAIDIELVREAVAELMDNAVKAGAGRFALEVDPVEGDAVRFTLLDDGEGISADQAQRIFEPLYQRDPSGEEPGAGLGLAILARKVWAAGGTVGASPGPASGAKVWFTLPAASAGD